MKDERPDGSGAYDWKPLLEQDEGAPEEFENPAGLGVSECDAQPAEADEEPCDPTDVEDLVLGETMPGQGIPGFDAEEDGGG